MAEQSDTTTKPANIRYDDFVANVHPDAAKPEAAVMLAGFIGHGGQGQVRIYPDPSLGTWYDVPEADVVHTVPMADTKLGGSYVWVRGSAAIKPGSVAAGAAAAPVGGWPPSLGCQPSVMACPPAPLGAQTNPPTLGCSGGCPGLGMAQTFTMGTPCNHAPVGTQFTNYFGCTAACAAAALGAGTMTGFFGCTAACPPAAARGVFTPFGG